MDNTLNSKKPCLVQTAQGFTVSYEGKFLYSKYNPQKPINQIVQDLNILPQTLVLCVSPVLNYGLAELSQKLPEDCMMLGCELDDNLFAFIQQNKDTPECNFSNIKNFSFINKDELFNLGPQIIKQKPGTFRRIIRVDFSAAAQLNSDIYNQVVQNVTSAFMTYWANRVTLVKFGRKYCTNFFKNLKILDKTTPIQKYFGTFEKPILVFGAGESAQDGIRHIKETSPDDYHILCADTALQPLVKSGIIPDGVFIEEAQNVICKCFIGTQAADIHIFAGLSSVHSITRYFKPGQISFFTTEFTQANFIDRFEQAGILPPKNQPFGSVGITAFYYAHILRKDDSVPIYTYGLDFAYSAGRTHTKGTMADNDRFLNSNRIKPDTNFAAAFCEPAIKKETQGHAQLVSASMYTTPIMQRYNAIMDALRQASLVIRDDVQVFEENLVSSRSERLPEPVEGPHKASLILKEEAASLQQLKDLLTGQKKLPEDELKKEITALICSREYLFLHFPDGHKFQYTQSFLNRVRVEVDYFLKVIR